MLVMLLYISRNSTFLSSHLNILLKDIRLILLLKTSEVSFFVNSSCVFAILNIIFLNLSTSNAQTNCFVNIWQKFRQILHGFTLNFLILVIWQINTFCIPVFFLVILTMILTLIFILFIALIFIIFHLASLAKWLSAHLRTKWLWVRISLLSHKTYLYYCNNYTCFN